MGEETHQIPQNNTNEEYTQNKPSEGNQVETDKEADVAKESIIQGEDVERKNRNLPLLHVQSIRLFHVSLEYSGGKEHLLL